MIRDFLLTNLVMEKNEPARFKVPLRILKGSLEELADFPYERGERVWKGGQVVAIKGGRSEWVSIHTSSCSTDLQSRQVHQQAQLSYNARHVPWGCTGGVGCRALGTL